MQTFEIDGPVQVSVENSAGEVRVTTTDAVRAEVEVTAMRNDDPSREAAEETRVEYRDGRLDVAVPRNKGTFFGREPRVRVDVRVPHDSSLAFTTASADVRGEGRFAEVRGKTASGDVSLGDAGTVRIESASGDLRVDELRGDGGLKSASGDIKLGHVAGTLDASVVSGDLRVATIDNGAHVQAVSGDIDLTAVAQGDVEVRSVSGDVSVGVRQGARVRVDVSTVSGDLESEVELDAAPGDGDDGPLVSVSGRTVSGDLRIKRAR
ncbi:MAG TPA: DUF4097 family beta strand repeat-containing protein [Frankiaceae bacterium]|nr:DUF4097 family beta strand repeat-containing protein [Frankiaceae bacterium]